MMKDKGDNSPSKQASKQAYLTLSFIFNNTFNMTLI